MRSRLSGAEGTQPELCRKLTISRALLAAVVLGFSSVSGAVVRTIHFDTPPDEIPPLSEGDVLTDQYGEWGVTFSAYTGESKVDTIVAALPPSSEENPEEWGYQWVNCEPSTSGFCQGNKAKKLIIDFDTPVKGVSWYTDTTVTCDNGDGDGDGGGVKFEAYSASNVLLEEVTVNPCPSPANEYKFQPTSFSESDISTIVGFRLNDNLSFTAWKIDNLEFEVPTPPMNVVIDIKPGSDPNSINLCSNGAVPVAIMGSEMVDVSVSNVKTETLRFADAFVKMVGKKDPNYLCSNEDVNGDFTDDLVCHFLTTDISANDGELTTAMLNGELKDGTAIQGSDSVSIVKDTCNDND